ncbi:CBN-UBC-23 protein [Caenorhabditis brenneri]|uniref:CBN-UBC-23 protein n=1 Tax=Caenorhabditis brenneri TaxID=135651 RepID=G0NFG8_CAEBE|nr:CBN-UBC-23 protein [Caenorhabditis brenneri]
MVPIEFLTTDELDKLRKFMEITNIEDDEAAHTLLVESNWNLEVALETFWLIGPESSAPAIGSTGFQLDPIEQSHNLAGSNGEDIGIGNNQNDEFVGEVEEAGPSGASSVEMEPLMPIHNQSVPDALTTFADNFERRYCSECNLASFMPMFFTKTLEEAIEVAFNSEEGKPLLFFFNHEQGKNKKHFIENGLCNDYISDLLRNNFVLFPWDVTESVNMQRMLQMLLDASMKCVYDRLLHFYSRRLEDFPLMVVVSRQRSAYEVIGTITGSTNLEMMCHIFHESFQQFKIDHEACLQEEMKRKHDRELLDKQNLEYQQSLMADLRRKKEKQLLEEKAATKNGRLLKESKKKEEEDNHRAQMAARKVPEQPKESDSEIVTIKFRLPGSKQDTRLFYKTDKVRALIDYLESKKYFSDRYTFLNSDIPKQDITEFFDCEKTFAEVNWPNKEIVFVNPSE